MDDCKYIKSEDITPWHGDVFDHPKYKNTCKITNRKVITCIHCNKDRCKNYESENNK